MTQTNQEFRTVGPAEFARIIKEDNIFLIDARHPDEFSQGHLQGAHDVDVMHPDFLDVAQKEIPQGDTVAVYCGTGKRSGMASEILSKNGYKVVNLEGGLAEWDEWKK